MAHFECLPFLEFMHGKKPTCLFANGECSGNIELHHLPQKSRGSIASDLKVLPVCTLHHSMIQPWSVEKVNAVFGIDVERQQEKYLREFITKAFGGELTIKPALTQRNKKKSKVRTPLAVSCNSLDTFRQEAGC